MASFLLFPNLIAYLLPFSWRHVFSHRVPFRRQTAKCTVDCNRVVTMDLRSSMENVWCRHSDAIVLVHLHFHQIQEFSVCRMNEWIINWGHLWFVHVLNCCSFQHFHSQLKMWRDKIFRYHLLQRHAPNNYKTNENRLFIYIMFVFAFGFP